MSQDWETLLPGYKLYFPTVSTPQLQNARGKVEAMEKYSKVLLTKEKICRVEKSGYFEVMLEKAQLEMSSTWPEFMRDVTMNGMEVSNLWGAVIHKLVYEEKNKGRTVELDEVARIHAGLMTYEPLLPFNNINASIVGQFVTVRGVVVRYGHLHPKLLQVAHSCPSCESEFGVEQFHNVYMGPDKCSRNPDCKNKKQFQPIESSGLTTLTDSRIIRIQSIESSTLGVPRVLNCEVNILGATCTNGDAVTITGVVRMKRDGPPSELREPYIEVIGMKNHKESKQTLGGHWLSDSGSDYCAIGELHDTQGLFRLLVASLCPVIYGQELTKAALILSLFGGGELRKDDMIPRRNDINVLMVGDPAMGKSQMLRAVSDIAPRSVYVSGTGSTIAGLTVTMVKDGDGFAVEAGALVIADCGVCCIDEFEKMPKLHPALLEAMEQQSVSIAKAGICRSFPARVTVVAASNPVSGHYDKSKTFEENINISPALLSRFDIVFLMIDNPNKELDRKIIESILGKRSGQSSSSSVSAGGRTSLKETLKLKPFEKLDYIPQQLIRKYVSYAKQYVRPSLSKEAKAELKEFYLLLRKQRKGTTVRSLESLMRLTEARAKVELREIATAQDAKDAIEIFDAGHVSPISPQLPQTQPKASGVRSRPKQAQDLLEILRELADRQNKNIFSLNEIQFAMQRKGGFTVAAEDLIAILNGRGNLLRKGGLCYELSE